MTGVGELRLTDVSDEPVSYPDNAILEEHHVAAWFRVSIRTVQRWDLPWSFMGDRIKRITARDVLEWMRARKVA